MEMLDAVTVGHWSDKEARTGLTVALLPEGTVASGEVRGGAPGTREWELLAPERMMQRVDAVVLAGGSAFGLAACDGVVKWLKENDRGFQTPSGRVPIVVGAVIYDLGVGDPQACPGPEEGYEACAQTRVAPPPGRDAGVGCGATVGKWRGRDAARPGGIAEANESYGDVEVSALVVANCYGDVLEEGESPGDLPSSAFQLGVEAALGQSTTLGLIVTNARLSKLECFLVAQSAHDGLARAVDPVHTLADGDGFVAASVGGIEAPVDLVRTLAARAVARAVRKAVLG